MNMDWVPWIIRATLIVVGIILAIIIWKGKKDRRVFGSYTLNSVIGKITLEEIESVGLDLGSRSNITLLCCPVFGE